MNDPRELDELLGVYALDAIDDPEELAAVEAYLAVNPRARAEVAEYREALGLLVSGAEAPTDLWSRIEAGLAPLRPPALRTDELARARSRRRPRRTWFAVAAAAVALGLLSAIALRQRAELGRDPIERAASEARGRPGSREVTLEVDGGRRVEMVVDASGVVYLDGRTLARLGTDRTYQAWCVEPEGIVSLGVIGSQPRHERLSAPGCNGVFAITNETAGGVPTPSAAPIASAKL